MKCGADKLSNANISKLLFVKIEQGGTQLAKCPCCVAMTHGGLIFTILLVTVFRVVVGVMQRSQ